MRPPVEQRLRRQASRLDVVRPDAVGLAAAVQPDAGETVSVDRFDHGGRDVVGVVDDQTIAHPLPQGLGVKSA